MYNNTLYDQHLHSSFSYDADQGFTMKDIVDTAAGRGFAGIAVLDHFDPFWPGEYAINALPLPEYEKALTEAALYSEGRIRFAKGIELGFLPGEALEVCKKAVSAYPYDFVIGSVHSTEIIEFENPQYNKTYTTEEIIEDYYTLIFESIKHFKDYDVLGHINSIDRYTDGFAPPEMYMPYIDEIFRLAISDGKGLEVNTSSFRYGIGDRGTPTQQILNRYAELGGEIVTIGSDSHSLEGIGAYIDKGEEMLLASGIRYLAVFEGRRAEFIKL